MKNTTEIQDRIFDDIRRFELYDEAQSYGQQYLDEVFDRPVYPSEAALDGLCVFDEELTEDATSGKEIIDQLHQYGAPATLTQVGGRYFGFVNGSILPASLAAKIQTAYWDQNGAMQVLSPISARLEMTVEQWLVDLFGLPDNTAAGFVSGSSMASFCGLAAARYRIHKNQGWDVNEHGLRNAPPIRIVTGKDAHSTIRKAISLLGFGQSNVEWVDVDDQGRIQVDQVPALDDRTILILQAGNVNSGSFDNLGALCKKAKDAGAWIHIDGAFGLWAAAVPNLKWLVNGLEHGTSWAVDAHKTLNAPYDSGIILCADREALVSALHMSGGYIVKGDDRDGMFYTPEMSRRARIFELWAALKYLGKKGIAQMISTMCLRAHQLTEKLSLVKGFEIPNQVVFNQVLVKTESDLKTEQVLKSIQEERVCWVGGSTWKGERVIRVSICSWATTYDDIVKTAASFEKAIKSVGVNV